MATKKINSSQAKKTAKRNNKKNSTEKKLVKKIESLGLTRTVENKWWHYYMNKPVAVAIKDSEDRTLPVHRIVQAKIAYMMVEKTSIKLYNYVMERLHGKLPDEVRVNVEAGPKTWAAMIQKVCAETEDDKDASQN